MSKREAAIAAQQEADEETRDALLAADARVAAAQTELRDARSARSSAVSKALEDDGWTMARVAEVLGVSHQRVSQLKRGE